MASSGNNFFPNSSTHPLSETVWNDFRTRIMTASDTINYSQPPLASSFRLMPGPSLQKTGCRHCTMIDVDGLFRGYRLDRPSQIIVFTFCSFPLQSRLTDKANITRKKWSFTFEINKRTVTVAPHLQRYENPAFNGSKLYFNKYIHREQF